METDKSNEIEQSLDLKAIFRDAKIFIIKFWYVTILLLAFGIFASTIFYNKFVPSLYTAKTTLTVSSMIYDTSVDILYNDYYYSISSAMQMAKVFPYITSTQLLLDAIKDDLGVTELNGTISASLINGTSLIAVSVRSKSESDALDIINSLIKVYPSVARFVTGDMYISALIEPYTDAPSDGNRLGNTIIIGLFVGFALNAVLIFIYSTFRDTIVKKTDFKTKLNGFCIAAFPKVPRKKIKHDNYVSDMRKNSDFTEATRMLRTQLLKLKRDENSSVFTVTSALPNEGKTTIAYNLALMLDKAGKKVAFLNADIRKDSLSSEFKYTGKPFGLIAINSALDNNKNQKLDFDVPAALTETNVDFYSDTEKSDNFTPILASKTTKNFIDILRKKYDFIIIDSPPCAIFADATEISTASDGIIFVVKQDYATVSQIINGLQSLAYGNKPIIGYALNSVTQFFSDYNYGYGYGYGYGYKYGKYSSYEKEDKKTE